MKRILIYFVLLTNGILCAMENPEDSEKYGKNNQTSYKKADNRYSVPQPISVNSTTITSPRKISPPISNGISEWRMTSNLPIPNWKGHGSSSLSKECVYKNEIEDLKNFYDAEDACVRKSRAIEYTIDDQIIAPKPNNYFINKFAYIDEAALAILTGNEDEIKNLINKGLIDPESETAEGISLIQAAENNGEYRIATLLKEAIKPKFKTEKPIKNNINMLDAKSLIKAIDEKDAEKVTYLLDTNGLDVNSQDSDGATPLMVAVMNDDLVMVKLLLARGADINLKDCTGADVLSLSENSGCEIFELLSNHILR